MNSILPELIWVAARPPIPPFSGITSKTLCGLDALADMTAIDLITFVEECSIEKVTKALQEFWKGRPINFHVLPRQEETPWYKAIWQRRFQLSSTFGYEALDAELSRLEWSSSKRLVVFDDIVLAQVACCYGSNAILSPHDCMSQMFFSHYRSQDGAVHKLRKYIQYRIAEYYERKFYHSVLLVHVITQRDRVLMEKINPFARYHVVPNADLLNPGLKKDFASPNDVLIWGDLAIAACAQGARSFLVSTRKNEQLMAAKMILIGKVPKEEAIRTLGRDLMTMVSYAPRLEDESGRLRSGKIVVIPDIGGAGIKNRVVNVVSSGLCLACLLPQMEGVEALADRGAINAVTMDELVERIALTLYRNEYEQVADRGQSIYQTYYDIESNHLLWREMIERAVLIRG